MPHDGPRTRTEPRGARRARDAGPTYAVLPPHPALSPFVESVWIQEDGRPAPPGGHPPTRILPGGSFGLCLCYGERFLRRAPGGWVPEPWAQVAGLRASCADVLATGRTGVLLVRFAAAGAAAFFEGLDRWPEGGVDLEALVPPAEVRALVERTALAGGTPAERAAPAEAFLLGRLSPRGVDALARRAAEVLWARGGRVPIERLARHLGLSRRHLVRRFRSTLGTTPKGFASVARFQRALAERRRGRSWGEVAAVAGFADQAHLVREVRRLAGTTPTRLGLEHEAGLCRSFNGPGATDGQGLTSRIDKTVYARPS